MKKQNPIQRKLRVFGYENANTNGSLSRMQKSIKELDGTLKKLGDREKKKK